MEAKGGIELPDLIGALSRPAAYPQPPQRVEVRQTHISVVFLADDLVYKIKKPVRFGFADFSTLQRRLHFCREEVRLNRRLAPDVYLDVVPICMTGDQLRFERDGPAIEWAVKMRRLPNDATLLEQLKTKNLKERAIAALARRLAEFHRAADRGPHISQFGKLGAVAQNARENFEQSRPQIGTCVSQAVFGRLQDLTEASIARLGNLIDERADRGVPCDTHGDLHLDHVYYFPAAPPPDDFVIIDCIEFNERFRFADPIADVAFLGMDFAYQGRRDLAALITDDYLSSSGDDDGRQLMPFYSAYRAIVRAKVDGLLAVEPEASPAERQTAISRSRSHWLLALGILEVSDRRPCLVLVGGLPGVGKSTLARALADKAHFEVLRTDVIRKELVANARIQLTSTGFETDAYTSEWTTRTYEECLRRASVLLFEGNRVLVDASFRQDCYRRLFVDLAQTWRVPIQFFECQASPETARRRLADRRGDASDADWTVYQQAAGNWELCSAPAASIRHVISTESAEKAYHQAVAVLADGLAEV